MNECKSQSPGRQTSFSKTDGEEEIFLVGKSHSLQLVISFEFFQLTPIIIQMEHEDAQNVSQIVAMRRASNDVDGWWECQSDHC